MNFVSLNIGFHITIETMSDNIQFIVFNRFTCHHGFWFHYKMDILGVDGRNI